MAVQGSFGRTGPIYWNAAEQYVRMNCTARIMNQLQELKNTDADCYCSDLRIEKFLKTLNKIFDEAAKAPEGGNI